MRISCVCDHRCVFLRAEDHRWSSDPVREEAVRRDDPDSVLSECVCSDRTPALHGKPAAEVCEDAGSQCH